MADKLIGALEENRSLRQNAIALSKRCDELMDDNAASKQEAQVSPSTPVVFSQAHKINSQSPVFFSLQGLGAASAKPPSIDLLLYLHHNFDKHSSSRHCCHRIRRHFRKSRFV